MSAADLGPRGPLASRPLPERCSLTCGKGFGPFRTELASREASISGMCQDCQNLVFVPCSDPECVGTLGPDGECLICGKEHPDEEGGD